MKIRYFILHTLALLLSGCVIISDNGKMPFQESKTESTKPETIIKHDPSKPIILEAKPIIKTVTRTKYVRVSTGCPEMRMPTLNKVPSAPKDEFLSVREGDNAAMDKILIGYIAKLRNTITTNEAIMRSAVHSQNSRCKK